MWRWLDEHTALFHEKNFEACKLYYAPDFVFVKSTGELITGDDGVNAFHAQYALFDLFFHGPVYSTIVATDDGYRLMGFARLYINLPASSLNEYGREERKHEDMHGRKWDCVGQAAFFFDTVTDPSSPHGQYFKRMQSLMDPVHVLAMAVERGIVLREAVFAG